jgi:hypothetical protein
MPGRPVTVDGTRPPVWWWRRRSVGGPPIGTTGWWGWLAMPPTQRHIHKTSLLFNFVLLLINFVKHIFSYLLNNVFDAVNKQIQSSFK